MKNSLALLFCTIALSLSACGGNSTPVPISTAPTLPTTPVKDKPVITTFKATPEGSQTPGTVTLSWDVSGASTLDIDGGVGKVEGSKGSKEVKVDATTTFALTATNEKGNAVKSVVVEVGVPDKLPVLNVTKKASLESLSKLAGALNLPEAKPDANGKLVYTSPDFQKLPVTDGGAGAYGEGGKAEATTITNFDFAGIQKIQVLSDGDALSTFQGAVSAAGLNIEGAKPSVDYSRFMATDKQGVLRIEEIKIDTQVDYNFSYNNYELVGPGAKLKTAFGPDGQATQLVAALRGVVNGDARPIISQAKAKLLALQSIRSDGQLNQQDLGNINLGDPKIVYFAPDLDVTPDALYPHYRFTPTVQVGTETVQLRTLLIPATLDAPKVELSLPVPNADYYISEAKVKIAGGKAPYKIVWTSSTVGAFSSFSDSGSNNSTVISYSLLDGRSPEADQNHQETLQVSVTDANGLTVTAAQTVAAPLPNQNKRISGPQQALPSIGSQRAGRVDVGTEWISACGGLGQAGNNAQGFVNRMGQSGIPSQFNWGEANAWERDFKRNGLGGGQAASYVDDVDMVFYTGHANGDGWVFCDTAHDNTFIDYNETQYGHKELEWLIIAACGPLQLGEGSTSWNNRWGRTFRGLHLIMGYANTSYDGPNEGRDIATGAMSGQDLRSAWINTAVANQPSSVTWSVMGVYGPNGQTSYNDHFWGQGSVSPDMGYDAGDGKGTLYDGWWIVWGPS